ncbi:hypothetical protein ACUWEX_00885 [Okibacterium fritillariae]|uniref:hypothetical protein n=1 Tax=Okibacterium fritillariae TaxID=123320 RepID=UPI00405584A6
MTRLQTHEDRANELDLMIRPSNTGSFNAIAMIDPSTYSRWYARLLSALVVVTEGDTLEFAYANANGSAAKPAPTVTVFTKNNVIVASVESLSDDAVPRVVVAPRSSLLSLSIGVNGQIDASGRNKYEWPGGISISLKYPAFAKAVELAGEGYDSFRPDDPAPLWALVAGLKRDLRE